MNLFEPGVEKLVAQGSVPNVYVCTSCRAASVLQHRRKMISNDQLARTCLRADAAAQGQHPHVGRMGNLIAGSSIKLVFIKTQKLKAKTSNVLRRHRTSKGPQRVSFSSAMTKSTPWPLHGPRQTYKATVPIALKSSPTSSKTGLAPSLCQAALLLLPIRCIPLGCGFAAVLGMLLPCTRSWSAQLRRPEMDIGDAA